MLVIGKIGLGLCVFSVLLALVAIGSFWFTPGSGHFNTGEMYDESLESNNDALRESLPDGYTLPKTRAEMHRVYTAVRKCGAWRANCAALWL